MSYTSLPIYCTDAMTYVNIPLGAKVNVHLWQIIILLPTSIKSLLTT